ncbi:transport and Golgi organization protein 1 isoform X1 [Cephus cinctus]|uniref:Transport and Golgi organization protein 1 isoform X1 n=1 Tax=Cephus cinctus TaxID=211228 RepID=A0AAJ7FP15_CEPCN|nr:transport and Golgi organization protein 1 isoform X1 [Cephus cinctus]
MTKISNSMNIILAFAIIIIAAISGCISSISDKQLCYDPNCSVPVGRGRTVIKYQSIEPGMVSFDINADVTIYSKSAGKRKDLWGVEVHGVRGYMSNKFLREEKVFHRNLTFEVPTNPNTNNLSKDNLSDLEKPKESDAISSTSATSSQSIDLKLNAKVLESSNENLEPTVPDPTKVIPPYEVIDGTTIPLTPKEMHDEQSYASKVMEKEAVQDEQPILSIHPNIAPNSLPFISSLSKNKNADKTGNLKTEADFPNMSADDTLNESLNSGEILGVDPTKVPDIHESEILDKGLIEDNKVDISNESIETSEEVQETHSNNKEQKSENVKLQEPGILKTVANGSSKTSSESLKKPEEIPQGLNNVNANEKTGEPVSAEMQKNNVNNNENATAHQENSNVEEPSKNVSASELNSASSENGETLANNVPSSEVSAKSENSEDKQNYEESPLKKSDESVISEDAADKSKVAVDRILGTINDIVVRSKNIKELTSEEVDKKDPSPIADTNKVLQQNMQKETSSNLSKDFKEDSDSLQENTTNSVASEALLASNFVEINATNNESVQNEDITQRTDVVELNLYDTPKFEEENTFNHSEVHEHGQNEIVNNNEISNDSLSNESDRVLDTLEETHNTVTNDNTQADILQEDVTLNSNYLNIISEKTSNFNELPLNRNLLNVDDSQQYETYGSQMNNDAIGTTDQLKIATLPEYASNIHNEDKVLPENVDTDKPIESSQFPSGSVALKKEDLTQQVCTADYDCTKDENVYSNPYSQKEKEFYENQESAIMFSSKMTRSYWETLMYVCLTAFTTLLFSLGYYYIENTRRDGQLIGRINQLEKELLVATKECIMLDDNLKSVKNKLNSIEDESFGSNEMVASLKADLTASQAVNAEQQNQIAALEKDLESATEAGLELERMLREFLDSDNVDNPLAQSVENLQTRLNEQQATNESLISTLNLKTQEHEFDKLENEALVADFSATTEKCQQLEVEVTRLTEELSTQIQLQQNIERTLSEKVQHLEFQIKEISIERSELRKQLKSKEMEVKDLLEVVNQVKSNNLDLDKLYNVSCIKAEATQLLEERDELKIKLSEVEGAHHLLEEHMKLIKEEIGSLVQQCRLAEKEKKDAETRLEVLSKFFEDKEAQRQKEEAVWLQKQGEVSSTVERIHTMQKEIHNYKQQIEMLKREILDQEREYKNQISALETKSHEQWVIARQCERRLEESKAEASQLRNRLTLVEKSINDSDPDSKLHRLETNGETAASPPLFIGAESSSSPLMFTGSSGVPPPPPPPYMYGAPLPLFLSPPMHSGSGMSSYEVGQRPPPLGGRLPSPPPLLLSSHNSGGRYNNANSPPPPMSPPLLPPYSHHRSPLPPFLNQVHPPLPPPSLIPPPLGTHSWGEDTMQHQRHPGYDPRTKPAHVRNHKGSLHSSGESLDKTHHSGKA